MIREDVVDHAGTALHTHTRMSACTPHSQKSEQDKQEVTHRIRDLLQEAAFWTGVTHKQLNRFIDATAIELHTNIHTPVRPHVFVCVCVCVRV